MVGRDFDCSANMGSIRGWHEVRSVGQGQSGRRPVTLAAYPERVNKYAAWTLTPFHTSWVAYNQVEGTRRYRTNDVGGIAPSHALSFRLAAFRNMHSSRGQRHSGGGQ